ncbi:MAG: Flp family type IVb pilin [Pseudomonadota bacterium]
MTMKNLLIKFRDDEDGAALTEYLILLGLVAGGVAAAVTTFGTAVSGAFSGWGGWVTGNAAAPS